MKYFLLMIALPALFGKHCGESKNTVPACIQKKIDSIRAEDKWNPPAEVNAYSYKGQTVYLFSSKCCDQYILLYDGECNYLCAPAGGYTGKGDGKCADFYEKAKHLNLVWKDTR